MNTDSRYQLLDRYLDGLTTDEDTAALTEAVEADPEVLACLCESAEMEAGMQKLLAPEPRAFAAPRIVPFWHWRRAGKWISTGAAAAALLTIAAVVPWPRGGAGGNMAERQAELSVKRFAVGTASPFPYARGRDDGSPLEQAEFTPGEKWLRELRAIQIGTQYDAEMQQKGVPVSADDYLRRYLVAAGVTFPKGASAEWKADTSTAQGLGQSTFVAINTAENLARIRDIAADPQSCGPCLITVNCNVWKFQPGASIPPQFATEKVLSVREQKMPRPESAEFFSSTPANGLYFCHASVDNSRGTELHRQSEILITACRVGNRILVSGQSGTPPPGHRAGGAVADFADMEFSMTLTDGQEAVLHLGRKEDGADWIITMRIILVPVLADKPLREVTLGVTPNVIKFDSAQVEVKAGTPVLLTFKNEACLLPHNFVLVKPGKAGAVGALADQMVKGREALEKLYVPESPDIVIAGTRLLRKGQSEVIIFTAPAEPGDYPYLCTFPGHWRLQQGILRVVK